jgi:hypothetical protein
MSRRVVPQCLRIDCQWLSLYVEGSLQDRWSHEPARPAEALAALPAAVRGHATEVVLMHDLVRLYALPWSPVLASESLWRDFAAGRFEQLFGEPSAGWHLRVCGDWPPRTRLAVAAPVTLLDALRATFGRKLRRVRVAALEQLERLLAREPHFSGALVDLCRDSAWFAVLRDGELKHVGLRRGGGGLDQLASILQLHWAQTGATDAIPAVVLGPPSALDSADPLAVSRLDPRVVSSALAA